jgi:hypothetical protein
VEGWNCSCGTTCKFEANFCPDCGLKQPQAEKKEQKNWCCTCNHENNAEANFCGNCGQGKVVEHLTKSSKSPQASSLNALPPIISGQFPGSLKAGSHATFRFKITCDCEETTLRVNVGEDTLPLRVLSGNLASEPISIPFTPSLPGELDLQLEVTVMSENGSTNIYRSELLPLEIASNTVSGNKTFMVGGDIVTGKIDIDSFESTLGNKFSNIEERLSHKYGEPPVSSSNPKRKPQEFENIPLRLVKTIPSPQSTPTNPANVVPPRPTKLINDEAIEKLSEREQLFRMYIRARQEGNERHVAMLAKKMYTLGMETIPPVNSIKNISDLIYSDSHMLVFGVGKCPVGVNDLLGVGLDVLRIPEMLGSSFGFNSRNLKILLNEDATAQKISNHLLEWQNPERVSPGDCVVVYYSGHGDDDETICLWSEDGDPYSGKYSLQELILSLSKCPARHKLLILDSCFSGQALNSILSRSQEFLEPLSSNSLKHSVLSVFTAGGTEPSLDSPDGSGGMFTNALLEALQSVDQGQHFFEEVAAKTKALLHQNSDCDHNPQFGKFSLVGEDDFFLWKKGEDPKTSESDPEKKVTKEPASPSVSLKKEVFNLDQSTGVSTLVLGEKEVALLSSHRVFIGRSPSSEGCSSNESIDLFKLFASSVNPAAMSRVSKKSLLLEMLPNGTLKASNVGRSSIEINGKNIGNDAIDARIYEYACQLDIRLGFDDAEAKALRLSVRFEPGMPAKNSEDIENFPSLLIQSTGHNLKALVVPCGLKISKEFVRSKTVVK